jgi:hypothetical protein
VPPNAVLHIDLELVSWKTVTLIGDRKRILKKVLKEGKGYERPNDGAVVRGTCYQVIHAFLVTLPAGCGCSVL